MGTHDPGDLSRLATAVGTGQWWLVAYLLAQLLMGGHAISQSARLAVALRRVVRELALRLPESIGGGAQERALRLRALSDRGVVCNLWSPDRPAAAGSEAATAGAAAATWVCEAAREMGHTVPEGRKVRFDALLDVALAPHTGASARAHGWAGVGAAALAPFVLGTGVATGAVFEHPERRCILAA